MSRMHERGTCFYIVINIHLANSTGPSSLALCEFVHFSI